MSILTHKHLIYFSLLILLSLPNETLSLNSIQLEKTDRILQVTKTIYGKIEIVQLVSGDYEILLDGKRLFKDKEQEPFIHLFSSTSPRPQVIKVLRLPRKANSQVVIVQQFDGGNECEGNEIWLLDITSKGMYRISILSGRCFATSPKIWKTQDKLFVAVDGGYTGDIRNRLSDYKKGGLWIYKKGKLRQLK